MIQQQINKIMKTTLLWSILCILLSPTIFAQDLTINSSTGVITSELSYKENGLEIKGSVEKISENYYRFEKFKQVNESFVLLLPHDVKIITNKSYGIQSINYFEDFKKITADSRQEVLIMYLSKKDVDTSINYGSIILSVVILFCIISIIANIFIVKYLKQKYQKIQIPSTVLSKEEKELYDCIKSHQGKNQKEIGQVLNWSKARVSALSNNLVDKKLIRKEAFGRVYKLYITNEVVDNK